MNQIRMIDFVLCYRQMEPVTEEPRPLKGILKKTENDQLDFSKSQLLLSKFRVVYKFPCNVVYLYQTISQ